MDESPQSEIKLFLAPMEGVTDWAMRDLLTRVGGIDQCVTEFLRVTDNLHSDAVFLKNCPELLTGSRTRSGTAVFIQLLGGKVEPLALNARRAAELGALGVDLNFGCPAKTVNRHDGGATLLKYTDRIYNIVSEVRKAVPSNIPVTAKIRLGFDDPKACLENAKAVEAAGANWLTVHCRTKTDGYKPPAYWEWIEKIKSVTRIRIVTNGEIWNLSDFKNCHATAKTQDYMIGRGALRNPYLFKQIKNLMTDFNFAPQTPTYLEMKHLLPSFFDASAAYANPSFAVARTKGWLKQLAYSAPEFNHLFEEIKILTKPLEFKNKLDSL
jgi:tRNA-dihydrouridine synthase C